MRRINKKIVKINVSELEIVEGLTKSKKRRYNRKFNIIEIQQKIWMEELRILGENNISQKYKLPIMENDVKELEERRQKEKEKLSLEWENREQELNKVIRTKKRNRIIGVLACFILSISLIVGFEYLNLTNSKKNIEKQEKERIAAIYNQEIPTTQSRLEKTELSVKEYEKELEQVMSKQQELVEKREQLKEEYGKLIEE